MNTRIIVLPSPLCAGTSSKHNRKLASCDGILAKRYSTPRRASFRVILTTSLAAPVWSSVSLYRPLVVGRDTQLREEYDFVIVGGAQLQSETVLIIESGELDQGEDSMLVPHLIGTTAPKYLFNTTSTPQPGLGNRTFWVPAGRVVGERNVPSAKPRGPAGIQSHIRPFSANVLTGSFLKVFKEYGSHVPRDGASGDALGAFWVPNSLDPSEMIRSYARNAYYDPITGRSNFHLLTGMTASKIIFQGKTAKGVQ
ncbi:5588_t:CDS:2, partial [Acaulospora colombiana]